LKARQFFGLPLAKVKPATPSTVHTARKSLRARSRYEAHPGSRERCTEKIRPCQGVTSGLCVNDPAVQASGRVQHDGCSREGNQRLHSQVKVYPNRDATCEGWHYIEY